MTQIFTVSELNQRIKDRLDADPRLHDLWASGEVSNLINHRSGHRYFTLKDRESMISCVLFRGQGRPRFDLQNGQNVLVFGDVDCYRPQGRVQLIARGVRLDGGLGARHLEFEALKEKLAAEGLFDPEKKRALPRYPRCIGIVTSPDGAALRDVLRIVGSYPARIIISPALVQGEGASASICLAFRALQGRTDLVIVCRGGGSAEDLWCFNSEMVARAIADCDCPVISAVGHETDVTIADFVADLRAPTPTAAARMAVPDTTELAADLVSLERRMVRALWSGLERKQEHLQYLERDLSLRRMRGRLEEASQRLDYLGQRLGQAEQKRIETCRQRLESAGSRLGSVSPLATLYRGYSLVRSERGLVRGAKDVDPGETLEITLADGRLWARVLEKSG